MTSSTSTSTCGVLFDRVLILEVEMVSSKLISRVTCRFPESSSDDLDPSVLAQFCFPEEELPRPPDPLNTPTPAVSLARVTAAAAAAGGVEAVVGVSGVVDGVGRRQETFSFTLHDSSGCRRFAYSRRFVERCGTRAECCCIVSCVPCFSLFSQLLDIVAERRAASQSSAFEFLRAVLEKPFPAPGSSLEVTVCDDLERSYTLRRPQSEMAGDSVSLGRLFGRRLSVATVVVLWQALMAERRVLVVGSDIELLSSTVNAMSALLSPFTWQHVLIPILPKSLVGYVTAPMPFFIGCLQSSFKTIKDTGMPLEELYLIDVDTGNLSMRPEDAVELELSMPKQATCRLRNSLVSVLAGVNTSQQRGVLVMRAFMRFFRDLLGDYTRYFDGGRFDNEAFLKEAPPENVEFLKVLQGSQLWFMFVSELERKSAQKEPLPSVPDGGSEEIPSRTLETFQSRTSAQAVTCSHCSEVIVHGELCSVWTDKFFHTRCFTCHVCHVLLEGAKVLDAGNGTPVCHHCCKRSSMPVQQTLSSPPGTPNNQGSLKNMWASVKRRFFSGYSSDDGGEGEEADEDEAEECQVPEGVLFDEDGVNPDQKKTSYAQLRNALRGWGASLSVLTRRQQLQAGGSPANKPQEGVEISKPVSVTMEGFVVINKDGQDVLVKSSPGAQRAVSPNRLLFPFKPGSPTNLPQPAPGAAACWTSETPRMSGSPECSGFVVARIGHARTPLPLTPRRGATLPAMSQVSPEATRDLQIRARCLSDGRRRAGRPLRRSASESELVVTPLKGSSASKRIRTRKCSESTAQARRPARSVLVPTVDEAKTSWCRSLRDTKSDGSATNPPAPPSLQRVVPSSAPQMRPPPSLHIRTTPNEGPTSPTAALRLGHERKPSVPVGIKPVHPAPRPPIPTKPTPPTPIRSPPPLSPPPSMRLSTENSPRGPSPQ